MSFQDQVPNRTFRSSNDRSAVSPSKYPPPEIRESLATASSGASFSSLRVVSFVTIIGIFILSPVRIRYDTCIIKVLVFIYIITSWGFIINNCFQKAEKTDGIGPSVFS